MVEPKYPGVVEQYINLGKCYVHNGMEGLRTAIISCMRGYKGHYQRAYRCLDAAAELMYDVRSTLDSDALEEKLSKRARGILDRELKPRKGAPAGTVNSVFSAPSPTAGRCASGGQWSASASGSMSSPTGMAWPTECWPICSRVP